jgi:4-aminobutyrate aminotransferase-like enzyme
VDRAAALGKHMRPLLDGLKNDFECVGDVRGMALYQMLDIVADRESRKPDFAMAERIRYYAALEGVILICVKNFIRICPPLIITEAQVDEMVARIRRAIERAQSDSGRKLELKQSSSLAAE